MTSPKRQSRRASARNVVPITGRLPVHDLDAEAAVLSACMLDPSRALPRVRSLVAADDFYSRPNREIYAAIVTLDDRGAAIDNVLVAQELRAREKMAVAGGPKYIAHLTDATPAITNVEAHAEKVRELAQVRRAQAVFARKQAEAYGDLGAPIREWLDGCAAEIDAVRGDAVRRLLPSYAERLAERTDPPPRVPTDFETLDDLTRGGIRPGRVMILGGAPGACKTAMVCQLARSLARRGVAVVILADDEGAEAADIRNEQALAGVRRDEAEELAARVRAELMESELARLPLHVVEDLTVEDAFEALAARYPDRPRAVIVDSLQSARTRRSFEIDDERKRVTDVVVTLRRLARAERTRAIAIATSELARGSYRTRKADERTEDLAAFKESGAIEYKADVAIVLRTAKAHATLVHATVPKNRLGALGEFALAFTMATATLHEVPLEAFEEADRAARAADEADRVEAAKGRIRAALARRTDITSRNDLSAEAGGNRAHNLAAIRTMVEAGEIRTVDRCLRRAPEASR